MCLFRPQVLPAEELEAAGTWVCGMKLPLGAGGAGGRAGDTALGPGEKSCWAGARTRLPFGTEQN